VRVLIEIIELGQTSLSHRELCYLYANTFFALRARRVSARGRQVIRVTPARDFGKSYT